MTTSAAPAAPAARPRGALLLLGFSLTLFLNAALLFAVQPMFSKLALPLLGGAPAVWNTCMLVFQALLLGGYLYAHLTTRWLRTRTQVLLHAGLLVLSLLALPIGVPAGWTPPPGGAPLPWLVGLLLAGLGLPFFLLSAGAPLLQQWFSRTDHPSAANPYFLYAASNAGSMLALLAYPLLLEPLLGLGWQRRLWAGVYAGVVLLVALCGLFAARRRARHAPDVADGTAIAADAVAADVAGLAADDAPAAAPSAAVRWRERAWWTLLAFAPSSLLLGATTFLSTDVAAFPLLWVVPLALYLLTFVLVFARRQLLPHRLMLWLHPLVLLPTVVLLFSGRGSDLTIMAPLHLLLFFVTTMVCHGELARLRPGAARLTEFYLWMSVGGALGGAFNVLLAPLLFDRVLEYQIMLALACALRPWPADGRNTERLRRDVILPALLGAAVLMTLRTTIVRTLAETTVGLPFVGDVQIDLIVIVGAVGAALCFLFVRRPLRLAFGVLGVLLAGLHARTPSRPPLFADRSFFGVYGVRDVGSGYHVLYHGTTLHGAQNLAPDRRREPLTYYRVRGPLGDLFSVKRLAGRPLRIGVVGLGSGSVACYARAGDRVTFYEIDPLIERIARDTRLFTYLADCAPDARVVLGDARISLARPDGGPYDVLVLDAFSSDAIPVHLLTREALAVYARRLAPDGVIAMHVSNRYLDLPPVVANLAGDAGMVAMLGSERRLSTEDKARMHTASVWVALARTDAPLAALAVRERWKPLTPDPRARLWTDDYSNVIGALAK